MNIKLAQICPEPLDAGRRALTRPRFVGGSKWAAALALVLAAVCCIAPASANAATGSYPITGTVTGPAQAGGGMVALPGIEVLAYSATTASLADESTTDANGHYALSLLQGNYRIEFIDPTKTYATEWYSPNASGGPTFATGYNVFSGQNSPFNPLNIVMSLPGGITGVVTNGVHPLPGISVQLLVTPKSVAAVTQTDALGRFAFPFLLPSGYVPLAVDPLNVQDPATGYRSQLYDGIDAPSQAAISSAFSGGTVTTVDVFSGTIISWLDSIVMKGVDCDPTIFHPNADLHGMNLSSKQLSGCDLSGSNLSSADLSNANLTAVNLNGATMTYARLPSAQLAGANLTGAQLVLANLSGVTGLYTATFSKTNMYGANLTGTSLYRANLNSSSLAYANVSHVSLAGASLRTTNVAATNFTGANFTNSNLAQWNAHGMTPTVTSAVWANTTCPDGTNSNADSGSCVGHL